MTKSKKKKLLRQSSGAASVGVSSANNDIVDGVSAAALATAPPTPTKLNTDDRIIWSKSKKKRMRHMAKKLSMVVVDDGDRGGGGSPSNNSSDDRRGDGTSDGTTVDDDRKRRRKEGHDAKLPSTNSGVGDSKGNLEAEDVVPNSRPFTHTTDDVTAQKSTVNPSRPAVEKQPEADKFDHLPDKESSYKRPAFAFAVDDTDHCETPAVAYSDLLSLLDSCCLILGKTRSTLRIYDPFYCNGAVIRHLGNAGFVDVYNRCEDFYAVQAADKVPRYDVLVTNPPYSGGHIEKLLAFCASSGKPWFCLLPNWVYTKSFYTQQVGVQDSGVWYLVRHTIRYAYEPPSWVEACTGSTAIEKGRTTTAPFPSFWYCWYPNHERARALEAINRSVAKSVSTPFIVRTRQFDMLRNPLLLCLAADMLPYEVRGELDKTRKRPNAKARQRMKKISGQWR